MSNRVKAGLFFGIIMSVFYIAMELLSGPSETTTAAVLKIFVSAIVGGAIAGLFFGFFLGPAVTPDRIKNAVKIHIEPDEQIVFQSSANHFKGIEGVGGMLYLTNKRLIFNVYKHNIQKHQLSVDLSDISHVDKYSPLGITNNGIIVHLKKSLREKFVVEDRDSWLSSLRTQLRSQT